MTCVSDTHPFILLLDGNARLSPTARAAFSDPGNRVLIPTIVLAEIKFLYDRGRISVNLSHVEAYVSVTANCAIAPLDEQTAAYLPSGLDIHDAIIVATALRQHSDLGHQVALITKDAQISASGLVPVIW